jgi:tRNA(Ile2) C34 agmatinyltransferase TiaS
MNLVPLEEVAPTCPVCTGEGVPLGQLGRLMHFTCRDCGMGFHVNVQETEQ